MTVLMLLLLLLYRVLLLLLLPFHAECRIHLQWYLGDSLQAPNSTATPSTYIHDVPPYGTAVDGVCGRRCP
jgi:hypothetical protein